MLLSVVPGHGVAMLARLALGLTAGISLSLCAVDATSHFSTGVPEALLMATALVACIHLMTGMPARSILGRLACGYILPWVGHFFVEHNRPATFLHPTFSFLGDFQLLGSLLTGRLALDAKEP